MESSNGIGQGQESSLPSTTSAPASTQAPAQSAPATPVDERTFRQSEVNDIVKRAKHGAVEDFRRLQTEQPSYVQQKYGEAPQAPQSMSQSGAPNENEIRRLATEEINRQRDAWVQEARNKSETEYAQRIVQNFHQKISTGKEKYQDFDKVTGDMQLARFPNVVQILAEHVDNAGDVLYELGKDRLKLAQVEQLAAMSPEDAIIQAKRMSQSLKDNEAASKARVPNEPLSQLRPSNTGTDNGVMSVRDFRNKYKG